MMLLIATICVCYWGISPKATPPSSLHADTRQQLRTFTAVSLDEIEHEWARTYLYDPGQTPHIYKSLSEEFKTKYTLVKAENIYGKDDQLIMKIEAVTKRISLTESVEVKRIKYPKIPPVYTLDTIPTEYLKLR